MREESPDQVQACRREVPFVDPASLVPPRHRDPGLADVHDRQQDPSAVEVYAVTDAERAAGSAPRAARSRNLAQVGHGQCSVNRSIRADPEQPVEVHVLGTDPAVINDMGREFTLARVTCAAVELDLVPSQLVAADAAAAAWLHHSHFSGIGRPWRFPGSTFLRAISICRFILAPPRPSSGSIPRSQ